MCVSQAVSALYVVIYVLLCFLLSVCVLYYLSLDNSLALDRI